MARFSSHVRPGRLEVFYGPMYSGKSEELARRLYRLKEYGGGKYLLFLPDSDTREERNIINAQGIKARYLTADDPERIWGVLSKYTVNPPQIIAFDETQFFSEPIVGVIKKLRKQNFNVLVAGLNLDFRGEAFGQMGRILAEPGEHKHIAAICSIEDCLGDGEYTQRLRDGKPVSYYDQIQIVEGDPFFETTSYEVRCLDHHDVPDNPYTEG